MGREGGRDTHPAVLVVTDLSQVGCERLSCNLIASGMITMTGERRRCTPPLCYVLSYWNVLNEEFEI